jgi:hypothetical protein
MRAFNKKLIRLINSQTELSQLPYNLIMHFKPLLVSKNVTGHRLTYSASVVGSA